MEVLTNVFSAISTAFTAYLPALAKGIYEFFIGVFCITTTAEGVTTVTGLNALGFVAAGLIGMGVVAGLTATVLGILRLRKRRASKRKLRRA